MSPRGAQRFENILRSLALATVAAILTHCGSSPTRPSSPSTAPVTRVSVSGTVVDRLDGSPISGSTIEWKGPKETKTAIVQGGRFEVGDLPLDYYVVTITGATHVTHVTQSVSLYVTNTFSFSVLRWGSGRFGVTYDSTFHLFFDQMARGLFGHIRKWTVYPTELYLVEGTVPSEQFELVASVLAEVNAESTADMWCGLTGPFHIRTGPNIADLADGTPNMTDDQILVRPNWMSGAGATVGPTGGHGGRVNVNVAGKNGLLGRETLKGVLLHELFHVVGMYHVCGGDLGTNPHGFSRSNCPFADSVMANLGVVVTKLSPQDKLAACLVFHPFTMPNNMFPDTDPAYK